MRTIAVIPARRDSKGLPGKNIRSLCGKPLVSYSIECALESGLDIIVASNNDAILEVACSYGIVTDYQRPESVSGDEVSMSDTLLDVINWLESQGRYYDSLVFLQPTSPFRTAADILQGLKIHIESAGQHVVGVSPMWTHPFECLRIDRDHWDFLVKPPESVARRQDYTDSFQFINGAFYCFKIEDFKRTKKIPILGAKLLFMDPINTIDIDTEMDFILAEAAMTRRDTLRGFTPSY